MPPEMQSSPRRLIVEFTKMSGAGNDFIVIDNRFYHFSGKELSSLARRYCPRGSQVGADGILALLAATDPALDYRMAYYNADGSLGTMCGNGARCLGRFARMAGLDRTSMEFESDAGIHRIDVPVDPAANVRLFLPTYRAFKQDVAIAAAVHPDIEGLDAIWTGTEHVVCWVKNTETFDVASFGPVIRNASELQPAGANINFAAAATSDRTGLARFRSRTFEKGVENETLACGTGAVAVGLVAMLTGRTSEHRVEVEMNGGTLAVEIIGAALNPDQIMLEGPADVIYRGTLSLDPDELTPA